jgi:hypothetical protein
MKPVQKYLTILILVTAALLLIVYTGSSNVSAIPIATATPTATPAEIPSFAPFFESVFGVKIFPGADPVGVYQVNINPDYVYPTSGIVSGYLTDYKGDATSGVYVYLGENRVLIDSYIATTGDNGYYMIDNVPFGNYSVYYCLSDESPSMGDGRYKGTAYLNASNPYAIINIRMAK